MATITYNSSNQTVLIYDSFYKSTAVVSATDYDPVYSYFYGISQNRQIAADYAAILFNISQQGGYNPIELLQIIQGSANNLQMNALMCYYLNTFKSKASMYGISNVPSPNQAVQRNVVL